MTALAPNPAAHRRERGTSLDQQGSQPAPPVKPATWEWYIPLYFWLGGISAGSWTMVAAEDLAGARDRSLIRVGRYLSAGTLAAGTVLLIADLGRPKRFHHMLRIVRPRSAMSLGSWGLTLYGGFTGAAAALQAAEDGLLGRRPIVAKLSRGAAARALHVAGLPAALFVGGYTGVLLASTNTPSWAARDRLLGPLFLASALSSGAAGVSLALELTGRARTRVMRRLARAEAIALAAELALASGSRTRAHQFPSARTEPELERGARTLMLGAGMAVPWVIAITRALGAQPRSRRSSGARHGNGHRRGMLASALALGGSLALRYLVTREGYRSARFNDDTWRFTASSQPAP